MNDKLTPKQRHFNKVYENAPLVECLCGCGTLIKSKDKYARDKTYVSGHNSRKYEDPAQFKREWNYRNREARYQWKKQYHYARRIILFEYLGNKCVDCHIKYDGTNGPVFHFHHFDPTNKSFTIGNQVVNKSMKVLKEECDKCVMLCANCHAKRHSVPY